MPVPVSLQYSDQSVGLPANYVLPPGQAFDFSAVTARINGASASGTFLVVLDLLSQDDKVIASARIDQEFAAGDTGVVSFAPDFRRKVLQRTEYSAKIQRNIDLNVATGTGTIVDYQVVAFDNGGMVNLAAQPTRITIPVGGAGRYLIGTNGVWNNTAVAGTGQHAILRNGSLASIGDGTTTNFAGDFTGYNSTAMADLAEGDFVEARVFQSSGGNLLLLGSLVPRVWLAAYRIYPR